VVTLRSVRKDFAEVVVWGRVFLDGYQMTPELHRHSRDSRGGEVPTELMAVSSRSSIEAR